MGRLEKEYLGLGKHISGLISMISKYEDELEPLYEELEGIQEDKDRGLSVDEGREQAIRDEIKEKEEDLEAYRQVKEATIAKMNETQNALKFIVDEEPLKYMAIDGSSEPGGDQ